MTDDDAAGLPAGPPAAEALVIDARPVPLGGMRGMEVHRLLPHRALPTVGAWCFLDRFGPQRTAMRVDPHPHIGLQTVTWPFSGEVRHRDAVGSDVVVRPGVLNLMTSGDGISHSEYSFGPGDTEIDALQLWVALPESARKCPAAFEQHAALPEVELPGADGSVAAWATVVMGEFAGARSPATVHTPLVGAEIRIAPGARVRLPLRTDWEHALVGLFGTASAETGTETLAPERPGAGRTVRHEGDAGIREGRLLFLGGARDGIELTSTDGARVFLIGGEPFAEDLLMWWNFVARDHEEVAQARADWERGADRFGTVQGHGGDRIPAPPLPPVRLTPRRRRRAPGISPAAGDSGAVTAR